MISGTTHLCPDCHALVVLGNTEVKNLLALPWVETSFDLAAVMEKVLCDDCSSWYEAAEWHRTEDTEYVLQKQTLEALDELI